jgi:diguanylate cyclase (GGDEF)-like protein/PAS domain S-box-containing protein
VPRSGLIRNRAPSSALYVGAGILSLVVGLIGVKIDFGGDPSIAWPSSCVGIALVLVLGRRAFAAVVAGNVLALLFSDLPAGVVVAQALGDAAAVALPVLVLERFAPDVKFAAPRDLLVLAVASVSGALVGAAVGAIALDAGVPIENGHGGRIFVQWLLGEVSSSLVIVPAFAIAFDRGLVLPRRSALEIGGIAATLAAGVAIGVLLTEQRTYLLFPGLVWAGLRLHRAGAAAASLIVATTVTVAAATGLGPFTGASDTNALLMSHGLIAAAAVTALLVAVLDEQRDAVLADLSYQRALMQEIVDASPAIISAQDRDGRYLLAATDQQSQSGLSLIGRTPSDVFDAPVATQITDVYRRVIEDGKPLEMDTDIGERSFRSVVFPLRNPDGSIRGTGGIATETTDLRRQEQLLARTQSLARIGGWEMDRRTQALTWSAETYRLYGADSATFAPTLETFYGFIHPDDRGLLRAAVDESILHRTPWHIRMRITRADGTLRVVTSDGWPVFEGDECVRLHGFTQDVTELEAAEQRYQDLVERLPAVVYVCDGGLIRFVSPQIEQLLGGRPQAWIGVERGHGVHPDDAERVREEKERVGESGTMAVEYRMITSDGRTIWVRDEAVVRSGLIEGLLTDVTDRKLSESQLQYLADHDPLTGLVNRRRFNEELTAESELAARGVRPAAVIVLDLDNFKYVNDSLGHQAGDALIRAVAEVLQRRLRASDMLTRLGGDEFAVLLRGTGLEPAMEVAGQLLEAIRGRPHTLAGEPVRVTASAGVVALSGPDAEHDPEALLEAADIAMYRAKEARDRVVEFSPEMRQEVRLGRSWADRIRDALERDRFTLYIQPICDLRTHVVSQWEVLVRMLDDDGGVIAPGVFLPIAERFGLIGAIDRWVILRSIALMEARAKAGAPVRLEVNVSGHSIIDAALLADVERAVKAAAIDPADLIFEVTETAAIANMEAALGFADRLARLGCRFALDDFGSGFASFYYLKHLPLDYVKIDGDFVRAMATSRVDEEIVIAMVGVARALGHGTIAEFVEDEVTLELLRRLGVDYAQGYHVGVPVPSTTLATDSVT